MGGGEKEFNTFEKEKNKRKTQRIPSKNILAVTFCVLSVNWEMMWQHNIPSRFPVDTQLTCRFVWNREESTAEGFKLIMYFLSFTAPHKTCILRAISSICRQHWSRSPRNWTDSRDTIRAEKKEKRKQQHCHHHHNVTQKLKTETNGAHVIRRRRWINKKNKKKLGEREV